MEEFDLATLTPPAGPARPALDYSWLVKVHLPAQSDWMHEVWDGLAVPGPHQSEPQSLRELEYWWEGALRYVNAELRQHAV